MRKYYYAGGVRVAMRTGSYTPKYLLTGDASHALSTGLGSTMVQGKTLAPLRSHAINAKHDGTLNGEKRYMPWGEERYTSGTTPTSLQYTGQRIESLLGIYFYQSRG